MPRRGIIAKRDVLPDPLYNSKIVTRLINNSKVSDHHAIIPTMELEKADLKTIPSGELNILKLVICKLMCAAAEPYIYELTTAEFECGGAIFTVKDKNIVSLGYKAIERLLFKPSENEDGGQIPDFFKGQIFAGVQANIEEKYTSPPKPYTEDICCERGIRNHP